MDLRARLKTCEDVYLQRAAEGFWRAVEEMDSVAACCQSPIERLFVYAYRVRLLEYRLDPTVRYKRGVLMTSPSAEHLDAAPTEGSDQFDVVVPQLICGTYRADFGLRRTVRLGDQIIVGPKVIVECDGHEFHERTKEQAAHDKERDRALQTAGFFVLRFTGSQLWRNAAQCAAEVDEFMNAHLRRSPLWPDPFGDDSAEPTPEQKPEA